MAVVVVVAWLVAAFVAGAAGVFVEPPGAAPVALGLAAGLPPLIALAAGLVPGPFRTWVRGLDLRFLTLLQAWRVAGFSILALWAEGLLPARFALPAGIGDMLIGLSAPLVALYLVGGGRWARRGYVGWTALGITDLVLAVTLGVTSDSGMEPMSQLPMSLIPTFGVPLTLVLHVMCLVRILGGQESHSLMPPARSPAANLR